jgi:cation transport ATPase
MKRLLFLFFLLLCFQVGIAQIISANIGINGLHCSACSYGTEKSIRKLSFVKDVKMDLNGHMAEITFKEGTKPDFDALVQKVYDAGFSVRSVYVIFNFSNLEVKNNFCYEEGNSSFHFINVKEQALNGYVPLLLIGDKMMPKKDLAKWKSDMMDKKCSANKDSKVYTVTL